MPYYRVDFEDTATKRPVSFNVWASDGGEAVRLAHRKMGYCGDCDKVKCLSVVREAYVESRGFPTQEQR